MTIPRALFLVMLTGAVTAFAEWRVSLPGWNYEFPRDHGTHTDFKTEWWYFTGNLESQDGEDFGYQLTFFRQGIIEPGREIPASNFLQRDMKFAHFAVSDISSKNSIISKSSPEAHSARRDSRVVTTWLGSINGPANASAPMIFASSPRMAMCRSTSRSARNAIP